MSDITPDELQTWLEWAGAKLIAMPAGRLKPTEPRAVWPEYAQDSRELVEFRRTPRIRALAPSSSEIPIIDEIVILPNVCQKQDVRKVIHWRAQIHPIRNTHLLTWTWIASKLQIRTYTAKKWHDDGLREILRRAPRAQVCRIAAFFHERQLGS